jgi:hypothetical protein
MNPIPPSYNLYEELPEPIFQDMKEKEAEKERVNRMINGYFVELPITNFTEFDTF